MNFNFKKSLYLVLPVLITLSGILLVNDHIYVQEPLEKIVIDSKEIPCDTECVSLIQNSKRMCVEIKLDEFVCRNIRGDLIHKTDKLVKIDSVTPVQYGEIIGIPEGKTDVRFFNIEYMKIIDLQSKIIQLDFNELRDENAESNIIYSANLKPGDTFVSHCVDDRKSAHLIKYMDLYEFQNKIYAEFWGVHPVTPSEIFPCNLPNILEKSLIIDYDLDLPKYEEFDKT